MRGTAAKIRVKNFYYNFILFLSLKIQAKKLPKIWNLGSRKLRRRPCTCYCFTLMSIRQYIQGPRHVEPTISIGEIKDIFIIFFLANKSNSKLPYTGFV